jgi:hypothetical protein
MTSDGGRDVDEGGLSKKEELRDLESQIRPIEFRQ